jgi:VanZ family protein
MPDAGARAAAHAPAPTLLPARVALAALAWFIAYGSLFPFDFADTPLPASTLLSESALFANRTDALDNFFLFLPFGAALQAAFVRARARLAGAVLGLLLLGVAIQLVQLWLPSRTASLSDVAWNAAGMVAGMLAAARIRSRLARIAWQKGEHDGFLACLVAIWICYESFPFVPTLDPGLLRAHAAPALHAPPFEWSRLLQHAAAATLAGLALMRAGWLRQPQYGLLLAGLLVLGLEVCVPYGALRRETLLGIVAGLAFGWSMARPGTGWAARCALTLSLAMLLFTVLTPYRGQADGADFSWIPFSAFFWYNSVGLVPPTSFEALAVGALLWSGLRMGRGPALAWCVLVLLLLGFLEVVRIVLAGYDGDTTTLLMALVLAPCAAALRPR